MATRVNFSPPRARVDLNRAAVTMFQVRGGSGGGSSDVEAQKGQPDGLAPLDGSAKVPDTNLPARLQDSGLKTMVRTVALPYLDASGDPDGDEDTAAIQAREDAGLDTFLRPNTLYWVKGLVKRSGTTINLGGNSHMKLPAAANTDVIVGEGFGGLTGGATQGGIYDWAIRGHGYIDGNKDNQTIPVPTVNQSNFNLSPSFSLVLSSTSALADTGTATIATNSGPQQFTWSANNRTTNTLTCSSTTAGRVNINEPVFIGGYGLRAYGYNFHIDGGVHVHHCVADGIWTEWGSGNLGPGTAEMESTFSGGKTYENGRFGVMFQGPHDSQFFQWKSDRNGRAGFCTAGYGSASFTDCHAWGAPQIIGLEDHAAAHVVGGTWEATARTNARAFALYASRAIIYGARILWSGTGTGVAGVEILNNASGLDVSVALNAGALPGGAVRFTTSGGNNYVRAFVNDAGSTALLAGTPAATDAYDIIPGAGTTSARSTQNVATPASVSGATDQGFAGWAFDPAVTGSGTAVSSGQLVYIRVKALATKPVSALWVDLTAAGSGLTAGSNLLGLYDDTGALLATSADQSSAWTTVGAKSAAISGASVVAGRYYYVGILAVGTTPPTLLRGASGASGNAIGNIGGAAAPYRFNTGATGQTALPSSVTLSTLNNSLIAWWAAIS